MKMNKPLWHILSLLLFTLPASAEIRFTDIDFEAGDQWSLDGGILQPYSQSPVVEVSGEYQIMVVKVSGEMMVHRVYIDGTGKRMVHNQVRVDRQGPIITPRWSHVIVADNTVRIGPDSVLELALDDGAIESVTLDGQPHTGDAQTIQFNQAVALVEVRAKDTFGNVSRWQQELQPDFSSPQVSWQLLSPALKIDNQWFAGKTAEVKINTAGNHQISYMQLNEASLDTASGDTFNVSNGDVLVLKDVLGNTHSETISWVQDEAPPELFLEVNGQTYGRAGVVNLKVNEVLKVTAVDQGVGVESQMYRGKSNKWQALPKQFRFLNKGRYTIKVKSFDAVGNELQETIKLKVKRR